MADALRYYSIMPKRRAKTREGMITMNVAFPPDLHRKLALLSLDTRTSINELIRDAIREYFERHKKRGKAK